MDRKYRQQGYQDSNRDDDRARSDRPAPRREMSPEERIQKKSLRHAIDREANEVVRCHNCGRNRDNAGAIAFDTRCNHCAAALHCCRTCRNFDSGARFQCRVPIEAAVGDKNRANSCDKYAARLVLDVTGRRSSGGSNGGTRGGAGGDPRSQFENLFKR